MFALHLFHIQRGERCKSNKSKKQPRALHTKVDLCSAQLLHTAYIYIIYIYIHIKRCAWIKQAPGLTTRAASGYLARAQLSLKFPQKTICSVCCCFYIFATFYCGTHVGGRAKTRCSLAAAHNTVCGALLEFQLAARLLGQFARRVMRVPAGTSTRGQTLRELGNEAKTPPQAQITDVNVRTFKLYKCKINLPLWNLKINLR